MPILVKSHNYMYSTYRISSNRPRATIYFSALIGARTNRGCGLIEGAVFFFNAASYDFFTGTLAAGVTPAKSSSASAISKGFFTSNSLQCTLKRIRIECAFNPHSIHLETFHITKMQCALSNKKIRNPRCASF